jgi:acyl dehydratase
MTMEATQEGRLTDEAIERMRARIGIPQHSTRRPHNEWITFDGIRHFAIGNGDTNPLWSDRSYASGSRWGDVIAPPLFAMACGIPEETNWSPEEKKAMSGGDPFRNIGQYMSTEQWTLGSPLRPGGRVGRREGLVDLSIRENSKFAGGVGVYLTYRHIYFDLETRELVTSIDRSYIYAERDRSHREEEMTKDDLKRNYSMEDIAEIDKLYAAEIPRGGEHLVHSESLVGSDLGTVVRGPLLITDIIGFHLSWGFGELFGVGALRAGYLNRQRIPGFYNRNYFGAPDAVQRCHWEDEWAKELGQPAPYDYGIQRYLWMAQLVSNWIGDSGQIRTIRCGVTKFNYIGDTQWISGEVTGVRDDPTLGPVTTIRVNGVNQREEATCWAEVDVLLPLDESGTPREMAPVPAELGELAR